MAHALKRPISFLRVTLSLDPLWFPPESNIFCCSGFAQFLRFVSVPSICAAVQENCICIRARSHIARWCGKARRSRMRRTPAACLHRSTGCALRWHVLTCATCEQRARHLCGIASPQYHSIQCPGVLGLSVGFQERLEKQWYCTQVSELFLERILLL